MCTDTETCCNGPETTIHNWLRAEWKSSLKTNLLLSDFECWYCFIPDRNNHLLSKRSGFYIQRWNEMEEREKPSTDIESLLSLHFHSMSTGLIPDFLSAYQADSNSSKEPQNRGTLVHPSPKSLPVIVCSWVSRVNMAREAWGFWVVFSNLKGRDLLIHASMKLSGYSAAFHS